MKDPATLKLYATISLIGLAVIPKAVYWTSNKYIQTYNTASSYLSEFSESALNKVGLQTIKPDIEESDKDLIISTAKDFNVNPKFALALASHESNDSPDALSLKGAIGIMQIMPDNYKRCGLKYKSELWIKQKNIKCGLQIFSEELNTYKRDPLKALNAYNGGPKCVNPSKGKDSPCSESIRHAKEVMRIFTESSIG